MESLVKSITLILVVLLIGFGCKPDDPDPNNPNNPNNPSDPNDPNDPNGNNGNGEVVQRECVPYIEIDTIASDDYIDYYMPDSFALNGVIDVLYENTTFDKIQLVVVYNSNYAEQHILIDNIETLPYNFTVTSGNMASAIRQLYIPDDMQEDDEFHFFTVPHVDGVALPTYSAEGALSETYSGENADSLQILKGLNSWDWKVTVVNTGHPLAAWIGRYYVEAVSYSSPTPGEYDEDWYCITTEDSSDVRNILIYGIGKNVGVGVPARIDTFAGTITIEAGTSIGDVYNYGDVLLYKGTTDIKRVDADIVGTVSTDGHMEMDLFGMVLTGEYEGWVWDVFNTHWTKDQKSAGVDDGVIAESKRDRFR
ncbi:MAG: hypothetical protein K9H26_17520 [Prolixibacteraceae bacterium]|nr:hypothetical protein [Prolixibacteraceae bacterium]